MPPLMPSDDKMVEVTNGSEAFSRGERFGFALKIEDSDTFIYSDKEPVSKGCLL